MTTVFVGGSRAISQLPKRVLERLETMMERGHAIVVGDANGIDKSLQRIFHRAQYPAVSVYCSGPIPRNNLGGWPIRSIEVDPRQKGFQFHAVKDREMALVADFGFMIWDGKSPGTLLNILRLIKAGKMAVLFSTPNLETVTLKSRADWTVFLDHCNSELWNDLSKRTTPDETPWLESGLGLLPNPMPTIPTLAS